MKKIFLSMLVIAFMSATACAASDDGGKKKNRKKAKTECKAEPGCCDPKDCDPKNCDPKNCDPKDCGKNCVDMKSATAQAKCTPASCSGNK